MGKQTRWRKRRGEGMKRLMSPRRRKKREKKRRKKKTTAKRAKRRTVNSLRAGRLQWTRRQGRPITSTVSWARPCGCVPQKTVHQRRKSIKKSCHQGGQLRWIPNRAARIITIVRRTKRVGQCRRQKKQRMGKRMMERRKKKRMQKRTKLRIKISLRK